MACEERIFVLLLLNLILFHHQVAQAWISKPASSLSSSVRSQDSSSFSSLSRAKIDLVTRNVALVVVDDESRPYDKKKSSYYKPLKYDGEAITRLAMRDWFRVAGRLRDVAIPILSWLALVKSDEMMGQEGGKKEERKKIHAQKLREMLISLGPTFIKYGQALSNRPDIVGPIYTKELEKLQDTVDPFPDQQAYQIIESELGRPASEIFEFMSKGPVASASLGQVYKARIRETGEIVAIKVQRPNAFKLAEIDLGLLRAGAAYLGKARKLRSDLPGIVDEFGERLWEELDYVHEAQNCEKFRRLYAEVLPGIEAPVVVDRLTTRRVLTMSWIEGKKLPWGLDSERLIGLGLECSTYQLLEKGFLHSDPHPGNLLNHNGNLCYIDFGMMYEVTDEQRLGLVKAVAYLFNRDFERLSESFVELGFVQGSDAEALKGFGEALRNAFSNASNGESLMDLNFSRLADNIGDIAFKFPIRIPPYWSLVIRCLTILEGIALQYNPNFKVVQGVYPFVLKYLLKSSTTPALRLALQEILLVPVQTTPDHFGDYVAQSKVRYRIRWNRLERMLKASSKSTTELLNASSSSSSSSGPAAATKPSSSSKPPQLVNDDDDLAFLPEEEGVGGGGGPGGEAFNNNNQEALNLILTYILSEEGAFLREALIEDILGALDDANLLVLRGLSLLTGGLLIPPPETYPDRDRLAAMGSLLSNLRKLAAAGDDNGGGGGLLELVTGGSGASNSSKLKMTPSQTQALRELARQVLATYTERKASSAVRGFFHGLQGIFLPGRLKKLRQSTTSTTFAEEDNIEIIVNGSR